MQVNPATEALYIANPLSAFKGRGMAGLFSTHPPMEERIRRLRELDAASGIHYA
jgi:heat shock protein HtpX